MKIKPLIVLDFSHTASRMLFTAVKQSNPKKQGGKYITAEFIPYFKHLIFNSLQYTKNKFQGELMLALDSRDNWRKDFYPEYKAYRLKKREESDINFEEYYVELDNLIEEIRAYFPYKIVKVDKAEADDIAGTICKKYGNERDIILVTSDHDWAQTMAHGHKISMFDPIKKEMIFLTDDEKTFLNTPSGDISKFTISHILKGDTGDNVPSLTGFTEFTDSFKSYLKINDVYATEVKDFNTLKNKDALIDKFDVFKIIKSGKNKGKVTDVKDIYKTVGFGKVKISKAVESAISLAETLSSHPLYKEAFIRNNTLVNFDEVPENIQDEIIKSYQNAEVNYDPDGMMKYFIEESLGQMVNSHSKFIDVSYTKEVTSSLDDFF